MRKHLLLLSIIMTVLAGKGWAQPSITNTINTITMENTGCLILADNYTIEYEIEDLDGNVVPIGPVACTVTTVPGPSGLITTISVPSANFPTDAVDGYDLFGENFYDGGDGPYGTKSIIRLYLGGLLKALITISYDRVDCIALPIHISSFTGWRSGNTVVLDWVTDFESNGSHFVIERNGALLGYIDTKIGTVPAVGESGIPQYYTFTDNYPLNGTNDYRLRMVDLDETFLFSNTVSVGCTGCTATPPLSDCSSVQVAGPEHLCYLGATYNLTNVPNYTTPKWSIVDQNILDWGGSDMGKAWVKKIAVGATTLKADIAGCTAGTRLRQKTIKVGLPDLDITVTGPVCFPRYARYQLEATLMPGTTNSDYVWYENGTYHSTGRITTANVNFSGLYQVQVTTACGVITSKVTLYRGACSSGKALAAAPCNPIISVQVDPVPASSSMRISLSPDPNCTLQTASQPYSVEITDIYGNRRKQQRLNTVKGSETIDVSTIPNGIYVLRILDRTGKPVFTREVKILR